MGLSMLLALGMRVKGRTDMGLGMIQGGNQDPVELLRNRGGCSLVTTLLLLPDEAQGTR